MIALSFGLLWFHICGSSGPDTSFEPLSAREMLVARDLFLVAPAIKGHEVQFADLRLLEPEKNATAVSAEQRQAQAVLYDRTRNRTFSATADLDRRKLLVWKDDGLAQPLMVNRDYEIAYRALDNYPAWQLALKRRGVKDLKAVHVEPWAPGPPPGLKPTGKRLMKMLAYVRGDARNPYARPLEGLVATIDLVSHKVVQLEDKDLGPIPPDPGDYPAKTVMPLPPLQVTQPAGVGFELKGHSVQWQHWRFSYSFQPREGLVLHRIGWQDGSRLRTILYRASLAEMSVPYGDPDPTWSWRAAFDVGEYGLGFQTCSLHPGQDVPDYASLFSETIPRQDGTPNQIKNAVAIYERDGGILWRHWDYERDETVSRRARDLVVCTMATVGNYDYLIQYVFQQDGGIHMEVDLTGIMLARSTERPREGNHEMGETSHVVAPYLAAVNHQHYMCFRLNFDIDGAGDNEVLEGQTESTPSPDGNAFSMSERPLKTETQAERDISPFTHRVWRVVNPDHRNSSNWMSGYMIVPGETAIPFSLPSNRSHKLAAFTQHTLWVTRYHPDERFPAGEFPNLNPEPHGLPDYVANNESILHTDVVVWYTIGVTHIPRPEDWPITPTHKASFDLIPVGFFDRNPALDVQP
jgi:primary-amine oxidase